MSTFLCFICHSTVNSDTNEETREKYREVVGLNLCPDSNLCFICCHMMNKLCLFRAVCLKRSLEYPVLFSEKGTINLKRTDIEYYIFCPEECGHYNNRNINTKTFYFQQNYYNDSQGYDESNQYADLADDDHNFDDHLPNTFLTNEKSSSDCRFKDAWIDYNDQAVNNVHQMEVNQTHQIEVNQMHQIEVNQMHQIEVNQMHQIDVNQIHQIEVNQMHQMEINQTHQNKYDTIDTCNLNATEIFNDASTNIDYENQTKDINESIVKDIPIKDDLNLINEALPEDNVNAIDVSEIKISKKKKGFKKIKLSVEDQKAILEDNRRKKRYLEAEFKCYNCALGFLFKDTYQAHMMRHEESNGEHVCPICTLRFASARSFRAHVLAHSNRVRCKTCDVIISADPRKRSAHARLCQGIQDGGEATCHMCGKIFDDSSSLEQHLRRSHRSRTGRNFTCNVCGKAYSNHAAVRSHMTKHINRKFRCDQCPSLFSSPYYLKEHKKSHITSSEQHYCTVCNVSFTSRKNLLAHKRNTLKHQQAAFECPICSKGYANQRSLASHIETIHSANKNHACTQCDARYSNRKSLVRHIKSHGPRPPAKRAVCYLCGTSLASTSKLQRHLKEVCEKSKLEEQLSSYYEVI